jgi:hypothetical protein
MDGNVFTELMGYDTYSVAEESAHQIKSTYKTRKKEIDSLLKEARNSHNDQQKMLEYYEKALDLLVDLRDEISTMNISSFDKGLYYVSYVISFIAELIISFRLTKPFREMVDNGNYVQGLAGELGTDFVVSLPFSAVLKILRKRLKSKDAIISTLDSTISDTKNIIKSLRYEIEHPNAMESLISYFNDI